MKEGSPWIESASKWCRLAKRLLYEAARLRDVGSRPALSSDSEKQWVDDGPESQMAWLRKKSSVTGGWIAKTYVALHFASRLQILTYPFQLLCILLNVKKHTCSMIILQSEPYCQQKASHARRIQILLAPGHERGDPCFKMRKSERKGSIERA